MRGLLSLLNGAVSPQLLKGELTQPSRIAAHPARADLAMICEDACLSSSGFPVFGFLVSFKASLYAACIVSSLSSRHVFLLSRRRQSPGRFLWRGLFGPLLNMQEWQGGINIALALTDFNLFVSVRKSSASVFSKVLRQRDIG